MKRKMVCVVGGGLGSGDWGCVMRMKALLLLRAVRRKRSCFLGSQIGTVIDLSSTHGAETISLSLSFVLKPQQLQQHLSTIVPQKKTTRRPSSVVVARGNTAHPHARSHDINTPRPPLHHLTKVSASENPAKIQSSSAHQISLQLCLGPPVANGSYRKGYHAQCTAFLAPSRDAR